MDDCKMCANDGNEYCFACDNGNQFKPTTNADRIRAMTDEELAVWLAKFTDCGECPVWGGFPHCTTSEESCACRWHEWLKSPAEDEP